MRNVLTLVAPGSLGDRAVSDARAILTAIGATVGAPDRLGPDACELSFEGIERAAARRAIAALQQPADAFVLPAEGRRKRLLVVDMESTMIENEMLDDLAAIVGIGPEIARITAAAMAGELDFAGALRRRVALLKGIEVATLERAAMGIRPIPGAATLVRTMTRAGAATAIVTGGFAFFAERVRVTLGFGTAVCNDLEIRDGRLTGEVSDLTVTPDGKSEALLSLCHRHGVRPAETLAMGDGANDIPMLAVAGLAVGVRPKPVVAARINHRIVHADLTAALYIQGYRRAEFAVAR